MNKAVLIELILELPRDDQLEILERLQEFRADEEAKRKAEELRETHLEGPRKSMTLEEFRAGRQQRMEWAKAKMAREKQVYEQALKLARNLSERLRGKLILQLMRGLAQPPGAGLSDKEFEEAWGAILKERLDEILAGRRETIPWEEVRRELKEKRERRSQET